RSSTSSCHCRWWENVITPKTDFTVDLSANGFLVGLVQKASADRLELWWRGSSVEMKRELKLILVARQISRRGNCFVARVEGKIWNDGAESVLSQRLE